MKKRIHALTDKAKEKRYKRSWQLYLALRAGRWKHFITSDEKMFYLQESNSQTRHYYTIPGTKLKQTFTRQSQGKKGVMVWAAASANGKAKLRFVESKAKVNADYYITKILTPFIRNDLPRLYPDGRYIFQQDSAPARREKRYNFWKTMKLFFFILFAGLLTAPTTPR